MRKQHVTTKKVLMRCSGGTFLDEKAAAKVEAKLKALEEKMKARLRRAPHPAQR